MRSKEVKDKFKQTMVERYGVEHSLQNKDFLEKARQTSIDRYGHSCLFGDEQFMNKIKQTMIDRYGVENIFQSKEFVDKMLRNKRMEDINKRLESMSIDETIQQLINNIDPNISIVDVYVEDTYFVEFVKLMYSKKTVKLKLRDISNIFKMDPKVLKERVSRLDLLNYFDIQDYPLEVQFKELLDSNNIQYERHNRSVLNPQEIDFYLEDYKIGFEIDELQTHNVRTKDSLYHFSKTLNSQSKGVRLIHLWEWELNKTDVWNKLSKWILNLLNSNKTRIFGRNTIVGDVDIKEEREFLNNYHLQGYQKSEKCLGLYYNDELVQLMSFCKSRYNSNYEWELLRLCTKYGYIVIGGPNRLLNNFISSSNPISIISYCDLSKFTGDVYERLGFKLVKRSQPQAIWYNQETDDLFLHSSLVRKGADKLLGTNYGKGTSNEEIAISKGYTKLYNCGISVYELRI